MIEPMKTRVEKYNIVYFIHSWHGNSIYNIIDNYLFLIFHKIAVGLYIK